MSPGKVSTLSFDTFHNVVNGENRSSKNVHRSINPSTGKELWDVPIASREDLDDAVASANKAFKSWSQTPIEKRKELLKQFSDLFDEHSEEFIELLMKENGKPRQFATIEVKTVPFMIGHHLGLDIPEERMEDEQKIATTRYVPLGVVGAICPWNYPLILSIGKFAPALLTGNCIITKPSPFTPYTALKVAELAQQIFPPGVVQAVGGNNDVGAWMCKHPGVHKISFTGSIATGKKIMESSASTLKRITLELGGNDASIILPDVDIEKVAPEVVMGAFQNSGQVCVATKRIYIHKDIYEPFLAKMVEFTKNIKVGASDEEGALLGPIQNQMQYERVKGFYEDVKKQGYKVAAGSTEVQQSNGGFFIQPAIIDNPPNGSRIIEEEPFGPIVPTQPWEDEEEVIARANNTDTGLGACVWSKDVERAERIARRLEAGSVFVNSWEKLTPQVHFGGHKQSGIGGEWGKLGLLAYCNPHSIHVYKS